MTGGRSRKLALALFVSLLVNVFLICVLVANLLLPEELERDAGRHSYLDDWRAMAEALPEPQRAAALAKWDQQQQAWEASRALRQQARDGVLGALAADPFDERRLQDAFTQMRAASNDRWTAFQEAVLATAPHVPLADRQAYVEATEERWKKR